MNPKEVQQKNPILFEIMKMNRHERRRIAKLNGMKNIPGSNRADLELREKKRLEK